MRQLEAALTTNVSQEIGTRYSETEGDQTYQHFPRGTRDSCCVSTFLFFCSVYSGLHSHFGACKFYTRLRQHRFPNKEILRHFLSLQLEKQKQKRMINITTSTAAERGDQRMDDNVKGNFLPMVYSLSVATLLHYILRVFPMTNKISPAMCVKLNYFTYSFITSSRL